MSILKKYTENHKKSAHDVMEFYEYLDLCRDDSMAYALIAERMVKAIGEPQIIDTVDDARLSRIFLNRTIKVYPAFSDFHGMEDVIEHIVSYFVHSAQGLEERKQILYLLGPVGGGKSSLAERIKDLAEKYPIYVLAIYRDNKLELSPVLESPLGVFHPQKFAPEVSSEFNIPIRYFTGLMSPWAIKRLDEVDGDISKFKVVRVFPNKLKQIGIVKTEPGDENNQDVSAITGKSDIRQLENFPQDDPDAYNFRSGALAKANQVVLEFVEMFKAPIKVLHPLLTATQEGNYMGTEAVSAIPFQGMILAHCFSDDTELLTADGWKGIDDVQQGTLIASMNRITRKIEYQSARKKFVYDYEGSMVHFKNQSTDHLVTDKHRMLYLSGWNGAQKEVYAKDFTAQGHSIIVSALYDRPDLETWTDDEIRLMVWSITDGSKPREKVTDPYRLRMRYGFKKARKIDRLRPLLQKLCDTYFESVQRSDQGVTVLRGNIDRRLAVKKLPEDVRQFSARQITLMLQEWGHTDGVNTYDEDGNIIHSQLGTNIVRHKDIIQEMATISGHKSTATPAFKKGYNDVWSIHICYDKQEKAAGYFNQGAVPYKGRTWCVNVENETLFARRNGKILLTLNSNEAEWLTFKSNKNNEAFLDRICVVKVPYCLRINEEVKIYKKMLGASSLIHAPCAPKTLEMLAQFSVLTRLKAHENSNLYSKMRIYNGENLKDTDPKAKGVMEYRDVAGIDEGMTGTSTRFAFKVLSQTFNYDQVEVSADPVHLMLVLEQTIRRAQFGETLQNQYLEFIKDQLSPRFAEDLGNEIQKAYLESYGEYGQNLFDRYVQYADAWIDDQEFKDPDTGQMYNRETLNAELEKIEKAAGISNPKDFRNEVVKFVLRQKAKTGTNVKWTSYEKLREVIEKKMFSSTEALMPIISFGSKKDKETEQKHVDFLQRMTERGFTDRQTRRLVEWYIRVRKSA